MLNTAEAPLAFSRAARFGIGAMTLGARPCPGRREVSEDRKRKWCVDRKERVCWREAKRKQKKIHMLEDIIETPLQNPCVYINNNIIISSVASKQQSDTSTTQAGAWSLLGLILISIHILSYQYLIRKLNWIGELLRVTKCNISKH